jgi:small-conductance mechanosensitive channel
MHRLIGTLVCLLLLLSGRAVAQDLSLVAASRQLAQAENEIRTVDRSLDTRIDADEQKRLRAKAVASGLAINEAVDQLREQLVLADQRVTGLGTVAAGAQEAPEVVRQRAALSRQRAAIDAAIKRGGLAGVEADQLVTEIDRSQAEQFSQALSVKVASPVTPAFWRAVLASVPRDLRRIDLFLAQGSAQIRAQGRDGLPWQLGLGLILGGFVLFPARAFAKRAGQRWLIEGAPGHRLRRSANAAWRVLVGTLSPLLAAALVVQGLRWSGLLPERWSALLDAFVAAAGFAGFSAAITGAVLMRSQPSWRIAPIDDATANKLRPLTWILAGIAAVGIMLGSFNTVVGASHAAIVVSHAIEALFNLALFGTLLVILGRLREESADGEDADSLSTSAGLGILILPLWLLLLLGSVALLVGYVEFSLVVTQFIAWATVLGCALYVMMKAADDIATTLFARTGRIGLTLTRTAGVRGSVVEQFGLLLSGVLRLVLVVIALGLLMDPFGAGGGLTSIFGRLGTLARGIQIGGVSISLGTILRGIIVLLVGLALVRGFMAWLENRYLPATDLDGSGRNSVSLIARYIGFALAGIWALASLGIGVERIALLLSALSVGIGFGLQAITQNFISGLILLAERPIKIGDLVRIGNDEGDVRRISVRSTEIELGDHSTLIVPNSELITKSVLNKTLAGPLGRIQIKFSTPITTKVEQIHAIVMAAIGEEAAVLDDPAPKLFVDGIVDDRIEFNCVAHVSSPRATYAARSNILMAILHRLQVEEVPVGTVPQQPDPSGGAAHA